MDQSVDNLFATFFKAADVFGNFVALTAQASLNLVATDSNNAVLAFNKTVTTNGLVKLTMNPTKPTKITILAMN
jgi:hypothetical protein